MRLNPNSKLRRIAGETIIVCQGTTGVNLTRIISLNTSARLLYEKLSGKEFSIEEAAGILVAAYHIETEQAYKDASRWAESLKNCRLLEE